jgi:hypothetical protein
MSMESSSLKKTTPDLHRFYVWVHTIEQWYAVMRECRDWFGSQWHTQPRVRRKLVHNHGVIPVWFDVPDERWATWVATKLAVIVSSDNHPRSDK